jgi:hypothetical protein
MALHAYPMPLNGCAQLLLAVGSSPISWAGFPRNHARWLMSEEYRRTYLTNWIANRHPLTGHQPLEHSQLLANRRAIESVIQEAAHRSGVQIESRLARLPQTTHSQRKVALNELNWMLTLSGMYIEYPGSVLRCRVTLTDEDDHGRSSFHLDELGSDDRPTGRSKTVTQLATLSPRPTSTIAQILPTLPATRHR